MKLLSAKNLSYHFEYELFSNLSLELFSRDSIAIIGVSGSGKSTLLHLFSTLLEVQSGSVELFGEDISKMKDTKLSQIKRDDLGIVFQSHYLFKGFSGYENLEVAQILSNQQIDNKLLEDLDIKECINQKVTQLSGGQQQRVSIARVLTKKTSYNFCR